MKVHCSCGRTVGAYVPKGGDGSAVRARRHKRPDGQPCMVRLLYLDWEDE